MQWSYNQRAINERSPTRNREPQENEWLSALEGVTQLWEN